MMDKFIPYEKLSKKEKRKIDQAKRQTWGELNPVTRKPENSKSYNRNKARNWKREYYETNSGTFICIYFLPRYNNSKQIGGTSHESLNLYRTWKIHPAGQAQAGDSGSS